jgi:hypothetical protein
MTKYDDELREQDHRPTIEFGFILKWLWRKIFNIHVPPPKPKPKNSICSLCKKENKIFLAVLDPGSLYLDKKNIILVCSECAARTRMTLPKNNPLS